MAWGIEGDLGGIEQTLDRLYNAAEKATAKGLYKGAGVVADNLSASVNSIYTEVFEYATGGYKRSPSPEEKAIVESQKRGVSDFKNDGTVISTKIGISSEGYSKITWNHARTNARTKYKKQKDGKYAQAAHGGGESSKPIAVIINSIEHGTSFMQKQPFMRKAIQQTTGAAMAAIDSGILSREDELTLD